MRSPFSCRTEIKSALKIMSQLKIDYPETLPDALQQKREQF